MLILFDIDGTLLLTGGLGREVMRRAGKAMLGREVTIESLEFSGRLDPLILSDLLRLNGVDPVAQALAEMREHYIEQMTQAIADSGKVQALAGAHALVEALGTRAELTLGVLTGNYAPTGRAKLQAAGWQPERFAISVWGDESPLDPPTRDQLPGVALDRYGVLHDRQLAGHQAVVIGDTVHDVACAHAHGCRSVGVATGTFTAQQLAKAGADLVVETLEATDHLVEQITGWVARPIDSIE